MSNDDVFGKRFPAGGQSDPTSKTNDQVFGKRFQAPKPICHPEPLRARQAVSGPQIFYALIPNAGPNAQADVPVILPFPCNSFFVTAVKGGTEASTIFFHLAKLNKIYAAAAITALGNEQWISMNALPASGPIYRTVIRFKERIFPQFYLDLGVEGGAGQLTIACLADNDVQVTGGLYT